MSNNYKIMPLFVCNIIPNVILHDYFNTQSTYICNSSLDDKAAINLMHALSHSEDRSCETQHLELMIYALKD